MLFFLCGCCCCCCFKCNNCHCRLEDWRNTIFLRIFPVPYITKLFSSNGKERPEGRPFINKKKNLQQIKMQVFFSTEFYSDLKFANIFKNEKKKS